MVSLAPSSNRRRRVLDVMKDERSLEVFVMPGHVS